MSIEQITINYLSEKINCLVCAEHPENPPAKYILVEKLSGGYVNGINNAGLAIQSYEETMLKACNLDAEVRTAMRDFERLDDIGGCDLQSSYNHTDPSDKSYRYQSTFNVRYYEGE